MLRAVTGPPANNEAYERKTTLFANAQRIYSSTNSTNHFAVDVSKCLKHVQRPTFGPQQCRPNKTQSTPVVQKVGDTVWKSGRENATLVLLAYAWDQLNITDPVADSHAYFSSCRGQEADGTSTSLQCNMFFYLSTRLSLHYCSYKKFQLAFILPTKITYLR